MTDDLVAFLRACLDEDEQAAQACINEVGPEREGEPFTDGSGLADRDSFPSYPWGSQESEPAFMAGPGHPARVLAEVQAKRCIIERHHEVIWTEWADVRETACGWCSPAGGRRVEWPCPDVQDVAYSLGWAPDDEVPG